MHGAHGVFAVTNHFEPSVGAREAEVGKLIARVAKAAGVQHFVWSTLPNVDKFAPKGKYVVPHFTLKGEVDNYIRVSEPVAGCRWGVLSS
jgi:hypothetical protein